MKSIRRPALLLALLQIVFASVTAHAQSPVFGAGRLRPAPLYTAEADKTEVVAMPSARTAESVTREFGMAVTSLDRQTIRELAPFSSLVIAPAESPRLVELLTYARSYRMKAIVSVHDLFFERDPALGPNAPFSLRADHLESWQSFVLRNREVLSYAYTWAFYIADEPFWNQIPPADIAVADSVVRQTFPLIPTMASMSPQDLDAAPADLAPDLLDIVGFHMYALEADPNIDPAYQHYLGLLQEKLGDREYVIIADSWWNEVLHAGSSPDLQTLIARAGQYRQVAEDLGAVALGAFIWQSFDEGTGLRDLPEALVREYIRIGAETAGRCGVPDDVGPLAGETALFFHDCRFYATLHWRNPDDGSEGQATAVSLTRDTGVFWFFDRNNIEVTVKLLDGRGLNEYWWVFWSHMTSLEVRLEITDTETGETIVYTEPESDTSAFHR